MEKVIRGAVRKYFQMGGLGCGEGIVFSNEIKRRENDFD